MPQLQLPIFPHHSKPISLELAFEKRDGRVVYFNGQLPVFIHAEDDLASFRMFTSQLIINGSVTQSQISVAFGISLTTVKRGCKLLREAGAAGFFVPPKPKSGHRLTSERLEEVQHLLNIGLAVPAIAAELSIFANTIHKAIRDGRLKKNVLAQPSEPSPALASECENPPAGVEVPASPTDTVAEAVPLSPPQPKATTTPTVASPLAAKAPSTASERTVEDGEASMGIGTCRTLERVAAALGMLEADAVDLKFTPNDDVTNGGVLCALPALLAFGLLRHVDGHFKLPKGFYPLESIFMLLAYLALARVPSLEQIRYQCPGEWGKLLGLDRIPEVKTLREKVAHLSADPASLSAWSSTLAKDWMGLDVEAAGTLLVDGHVRVYHGAEANLPRRYVSREKLCLRGTTDYWVNAMDGQPFFCVTKAVDPGLQKTLEEDIIPRLLKDVPGQPSEEMLKANPLLHRFTLIFDREGYSPDLFGRCKAKRIACISYHKHPGPNWDPSEFFPCEQTHQITGEKTTLQLAERGTKFSNGLWVREIRKLEEDGHQVAVIATDYTNNVNLVSVKLFARWSQENFFKYMRQHYGLDTLVEHGSQPLPETTKVVNPAWRALDSGVRKVTTILTRIRARFSARSLRPEETTPEAIAKHEERQGIALLEIQAKEAEQAKLKAAKKEQSKHVQLKDLPEEERATQLNFARKHFMDTIKLVAYRAETALVSIAREELKRLDDARSFIRGLMKTTINLRPDEANKILTIQLHGQTNASHDRVVSHLVEELNATETTYPGTEMVMKFVTLRPTIFP